jgi:hypothetical protein
VKKKKAEVGEGSRDGREVTPKSGERKVGAKSQERQVQRRKLLIIQFYLILKGLTRSSNEYSIDGHIKGSSICVQWQPQAFL